MKLRAFRKPLSIAKMAEKAGVGSATWECWELGTRSPNLTSAGKVAKNLGLKDALEFLAFFK